MLTHTFKQVSPHVHWLSPNSATDRPTLGVVSGARATLLVDAGNSPAHVRHLLQEMERNEIAAPSFVMLTHWHWDHVFGTGELRAPLIAHTETQRIVAEMAQWEWDDAALDARVAQGVEIPFCRENIVKELPDRSSLVLRAPEIGFSERVALDLGNVTCEIIHVGGDHAADSSIAYVPQDKVAFVGDCLYLDIYHAPNRYTKRKLFPLLERLLALDAEIYFQGHHPQPTTRAELVEFADLLKAIGNAVESPEQDRMETFAELKKQTELKLLDEDIEYVDAFIAGLKN